MTATRTEADGGGPKPSDLPEAVWKSADRATEFLDGARRELRAVERRVLSQLGLSPGMSVLDVGCGTGTDIEELAALVGPDASVAGVDTSQELIRQARERSSADVRYQVGSAQALPFQADGFDTVYAKRVVEHVPDQLAAVREMLRVTVPGGKVLVADPDHGMWSPDMDDIAFTRDLMAWWCDHIPHPWTGRRLPGLLRAAGAEDVRLETIPLQLRSLAAADSLTWINKAATAASKQGVFDDRALREWDEELRRRDAEGEFLMLGVLVVASGRKPSSR